MASRVTDEIAGYMVELGTDGGLLGLQLEELTAGTARSASSSCVTTLRPDRLAATSLRTAARPRRGVRRPRAGAARAGADRLRPASSADELLDMQAVAAAVRPGLADDLDQQVSARGYRLLGQVPRLPARQSPAS